MVDFGLALIEHKEALIGLPRAEGETSNAELFGQVLDRILAAAIPKVLGPGRSEWPRTVSRLLSICIPGNRTKCYGDLLDVISRPHNETFYTRYLKLYAIIIPNLVKLLDEHGIGVSSFPSRKFFCHIIGTYLQEVLGCRKGSPYLKIPMLTCGHEACTRVNDFLRSEDKKMTIPLDNAIQRCVSDLGIGYEPFEWRYHQFVKPPRMDLTKTHETMAAQDWNIRLAEAQKMLRSIGTDEEISQIMGERYRDVVEALAGSQAFVVTETLDS